MPQKRIPTPTQDSGNWGTILNDHLSQTKNPINGAFNSFDQLSQRPTNLIADDAGRTYLYTQTGNWHEWSGTEWNVQNKSEINVKDYGAIGDGVADDTVAIQKAIDYGSVSQSQDYQSKCNTVFFPNGKYRVTNTLNLTTTLNFLRIGLTIKFQVRSDEFSFGTLLIGETGNKPVIETTGTSCLTLINVGIKSGVNNPSTLGILMARPQGELGGQFRNKFSNLFIYLGSNTIANNGFGTIGIINIAAEECEYETIEIWANTCFASSSYKGFRISNFDATFKTYIAESAFGIELTSGNSNTVYKFSGNNRFVSFDYVSPIVLIYVGSSFDFGSTFMQKRDSGSTKIGDYMYAIESWSCANFYHKGNIEGCSHYLLTRREFQMAEINVFMFLRTDDNLSNGMIQCWDDGNRYHITNSNIIFLVNQNPFPLISFRSWTNQATSGFSVLNSTIKYSLQYVPSLIAQEILNNSSNSSFLFSDKSIKFEDTNMITRSSAIPTTGSYKVGDTVYNTLPSAGGFEGWICTAAGNPGTWKGFGLIEN